VISRAAVDDEIEWIVTNPGTIRHFQAREARMGTAMNEPDCGECHGFYEAADNFYAEFPLCAGAQAPGLPPTPAKRPHCGGTGVNPRELDEHSRLLQAAPPSDGNAEQARSILGVTTTVSKKGWLDRL